MIGFDSYAILTVKQHNFARNFASTVNSLN